MSEQREQRTPNVGVLLVNLGTPDQPTSAAVRRYLREFLSDPRVIDTPRLLWWFILNGIILLVRPAKVAKLYQAVWTEAGSPLLAIGKRQAQALQLELEQRTSAKIPVVLAMTYGNPSVSQALDDLRDQGCEKILVLPLYPQYSGTTTAAVYDAVAKALRQQPDIPGLRFIKDYHLLDGYIEALAESVQEHWQSNGQAQRLLMSFHGVPERYVDAGDPYVGQCRATAQALADKLALSDDQWLCSFQSRFGPAEWVKPYTDKVLQAWGKEGVESVDVICPAFAADCLETLEEIKIQNRDFFLEAGGKEYRYISALNDRAAFIQCLASLVENNSGGW